MKYIFMIVLLALAAPIIGQDNVVIQTFQDRRVINMHSVETLPAGKLDFRIAHRFGDLAGSSGGWQTFFGLENAADVLIGFEYGVTDRLMVGVSRTKGAGPLKQLVTSLVKVRIMAQDEDGSNPLSFTVAGSATISTMQKSDSEGVLHFFERSAHRWSYHMDFLLARKFNKRLSGQFKGSWTYRNIVSSSDINDLPAIGFAGRYKVSKSLALLGEGTFPISSLRSSENGFYPALGFGLEFDTSGGHVFQLNFTNATGLVETDYVPYTQSNWGDGEFRLGFTISRLFSL